jgi:hypothetical protein
MKWIGSGWSEATWISGLSEGKELYRNVAMAAAMKKTVPMIMNVRAVSD